MRCNFVATISLFLGIDDVSSQHCYSCDVLSSSGITRLHRYYDVIRLPLPRLPFSLYYRLAGILALPAREQRTSRVAAYSQCPTCHGLRPRRGVTDLPFASEHFDFRIEYNVVPLDYNLSRLNPFNLTAYGLSSRCPTLNLGDYSPSIQGLATRWLASLPGRASHPLKYATLPGRTS
jgi:hypothetical protein